MKFLIVVLAALLMWNCATPENYEKLLKSWVGLNAVSLISKWGPPQSTINNPGGQKTYIWIRRGNVTVSGSSMWMTGAPARQVELWCKTSFTVSEKGRIESWSKDGNNCVAGIRN